MFTEWQEAEVAYIPQKNIKPDNCSDCNNDGLITDKIKVILKALLTEVFQKVFQDLSKRYDIL